MASLTDVSEADPDFRNALRSMIAKQGGIIKRLEPLASRAEQAESEVMRLQLSLDVMTKRYEMAVAELACLIPTPPPSPDAEP